MRVIFYKNFDKNSLKMQGKFPEFLEKRITIIIIGISNKLAIFLFLVFLLFCKVLKQHVVSKYFCYFLYKYKEVNP